MKECYVIEKLALLTYLAAVAVAIGAGIAGKWLIVGVALGASAVVWLVAIGFDLWVTRHVDARAKAKREEVCARIRADRCEYEALRARYEHLIADREERDARSPTPMIPRKRSHG